jgi:predicted kinase
MRGVILIVLGAPATGKTSIGNRLAQSLKIPYFSKDGVKEPVFDELGCPVAMETDEPLSGRKMDNAALSILIYLIEMQLRAGCGCIIDSTFQKHHAPTLKALMFKYHFTPIQIMCSAEESELEKRFKRRAKTAERHAGHLDHSMSDKFDMERLVQTFQQPLDIGGHLLNVDSTDFQEDDYQRLLNSVNQLIGQEST